MRESHSQRSSGSLLHFASTPVTFFRKAWFRARALWRLLRKEKSSPRQIGLAVAAGAFVGCTPAVGFHGGLAVALATVLRLNRLWAWLGSRVSNFVILPFIAIGEIQLAHRLRAGTFVSLNSKDVLDKGGALLVDWSLGCLILGPVIAALTGWLAYTVMRLKRERARLRLVTSQLPQSS